ncbi:hypothetical protein AYI69_g2379 [Smittium culicis]|uniref:Uncharacterized protein n=1 Tax=Smittium culicis TaxID=133412 RepID=A0A1R1YMQ2_9FUNG|nr:hypothetical protein AYI69_g2379 [Smittium culicis]
MDEIVAAAKDVRSIAHAYARFTAALDAHARSAANNIEQAARAHAMARDSGRDRALEHVLVGAMERDLADLLATVRGRRHSGIVRNTRGGGGGGGHGQEEEEEEGRGRGCTRAGCGVHGGDWADAPAGAGVGSVRGRTGRRGEARNLARIARVPGGNGGARRGSQRGCRYCGAGCGDRWRRAD